MAQAVDRPGMARIRLGSWMMIAGTLGAILALLTWVDVWDASDTRPTGWAFVGAACGVLALAGFAVCFTGLQEKARSAAGPDDPAPPSAPPTA
jgi:Na+/melibiose symporter-like transporter